MCWSPEVSIATYAISALAGIVSGGVKPMFWNFIHVQLCEFFMWMDQGCDKGANRIASYACAALVSLQPLCGLLSVNIICGIPMKTWIITVYCLTTAVYGYIMLIKPSVGDMCSRPPEDGSSRHLSWKFMPDRSDPILILYVLTFFAPYVYLAFRRPTIENIVSVVANTFIIGYSYYAGSVNKTWGSDWCFWSNVISIYVLIKSLCT